MFLAVLAVVISSEATSMHRAPPDRSTRERAAAVLEGALAAATPAGLRSAASAAEEVLGPTSRNRERIAVAVEPLAAKEAPQSAVKEAVSTLRAIATDLVFVPRMEADRPRGFPAFTPVGEIEVLDYPAYRMARVVVAPRGVLPRESSFWTLFRHIQSRGIPMTAPVEMSHGERGAALSSMAFLYASTDVGELGRDGSIEIVDAPAARVASLGMRGASSEARILRARDALEAWIARDPTLEIAGPARSMGWHGPSVPVERKYFEVQIPIRTKVAVAR